VIGRPDRQTRAVDLSDKADTTRDDMKLTIT
jgi:hypothetical protein